MAGGTLTTLAYHRIDTPDNTANRDLSPALIDAYPDEFEAQMRWIAGRYNVISGWQLVESLRDGKPLPPRALMITFDDGNSCFMDTAAPIMRRYGLPSTLFVATGYTSNPCEPFWWDTLHRVIERTENREIEVPGVGRLALGTKEQRGTAYKTLVVAVEHSDADEAERLVEMIAQACGIKPSSEKQRLDWTELIALSETGDVAIGPHTRRHPILSRTNPQRMRDEIEGSLADLNAHLKRPLPLFAYPNGQSYAIGETSSQAVRSAGLIGAFTMMAGYNTPGKTDPYMMHRIGATAGLSLNRFKLRISPLGSALRRGKALLRHHA